jgi:PII-like signaling protein
MARHEKEFAMKIEGPGERLTIFVGESDQYGHRPLYTEIVERAHDAGLAGATAIRGFEGFGASSRIHTARILRLSEDLPVVVIIVDRPDRIDAFLPTLDEIVSEGLVVREPVEIVKYVGRAEDA